MKRLLLAGVVLLSTTQFTCAQTYSLSAPLPLLSTANTWALNQSFTDIVSTNNIESSGNWLLIASDVPTNKIFFKNGYFGPVLLQMGGTNADIEPSTDIQLPGGAWGSGNLVNNLAPIYQNSTFTGTTTAPAASFGAFLQQSDNSSNTNGIGFFEHLIANGSGVVGTRGAGMFLLDIAATTGNTVLQEYVGLTGKCNLMATDGPGPTTANRSVCFASNPVAHIGANVLSGGVVGEEIDTWIESGASVLDRIGLQIVDVTGTTYGTQATRDDVSLTINNQYSPSSTLGFKVGLEFGRTGGNFPVATNGTLIYGQANGGGNWTVANGIDWHLGTVTGDWLNLGGKFTIDGSGNTTIGGTLTVSGVTVINNSTNINSYLGIGNNTNNGTMTLDGPTANARWIGLQDTGYDRWQIALDGTTSYNATANWAISVAYTINTVVNNLGNAYKVTTAGTSAASGTGPSGTGTAITDGTVVWTYLGPANTGDNFVLWAWDDPRILRTSPFSITRSTLQGYFSYGLYVSDYFNTTSANAGSVTITPLTATATATSGTAQITNTLSPGGNGGSGTTSLELNKLTLYGAPTNNWWVGLDQLQWSGSGGNGQHVARYAQTTRYGHSTGGASNNPQLWGMISENDDFTGLPSSQTNAQLSMEFDLTGHGIDDANNRQNQIVVIRPAADNTNYFEVNSGVGIVMNTGGYVKRALGVGGSFTTTALDFRYARSFEPNAISLSTNTGTYVTVTTAVTSSVTIPVSNVMPFTSDFIGRDINTGFTNTIFFSDGQSASETGYAITGTGPTPTGTITVSVAISEAAGNYVFNNSRTIWLGSNMNISLDDNGIVNLFGDGTNAHITAPLTIPTLNLAAANGSASYSQIYVDSAANTYNNDVVFRTGPSGTYHYTIIDQSGNLNVPAIVTVNSGYFDASHTTNAFAWAIGPNNVPLRAVNAAGNASYNLLILNPSNAAFVASDPAITGVGVGNGTSSITLSGPIFAADTTTTPGGKQPLCIDTTTKQIYMGNGGTC